MKLHTVGVLMEVTDQLLGLIFENLTEMFLEQEVGVPHKRTVALRGLLEVEVVDRCLFGGT